MPKSIKWAISESPLIDGNLLIVMPGGEKATLVALNKMTSETIWTSHSPNRDKREPASYASMLAINVDGQRQIIASTEAGGFAARASDGKFLSGFPMGGASTSTLVKANGKTANHAMLLSLSRTVAFTCETPVATWCWSNPVRTTCKSYPDSDCPSPAGAPDIPIP